MKLITSQSLLKDINPLISLLLASTRAFELPYFKISCLYKKTEKGLLFKCVEKPSPFRGWE